MVHMSAMPEEAHDEDQCLSGGFFCLWGTKSLCGVRNIITKVMKIIPQYAVITPNISYGMELPAHTARRSMNKRM